jgi:hypothetical protein
MENNRPGQKSALALNMSQDRIVGEGLGYGLDGLGFKFW